MYVIRETGQRMFLSMFFFLKRGEAPPAYPEEHMAFPVQLRDIIAPESPGSSPGPFFILMLYLKDSHKYMIYKL